MPHEKQNPKKGVLNFLEDLHPRILLTTEISHPKYRRPPTKDLAKLSLTTRDTIQNSF